jgi:hypothetical protein
VAISKNVVIQKQRHKKRRTNKFYELGAPLSQAFLTTQCLATDKQLKHLH